MQHPAHQAHALPAAVGCSAPAPRLLLPLSLPHRSMLLFSPLCCYPGTPACLDCRCALSRLGSEDPCLPADIAVVAWVEVHQLVFGELFAKQVLPAAIRPAPPRPAPLPGGGGGGRGLPASVPAPGP